MAHVDVGALEEQLRRAACVVDDEQRHEDVARHVVEAAGKEVVYVLAAGLFHVVYGLLVQLHHLAGAYLQPAHILGHLVLQHLLHHREVSAVGDVAYCGHHLQLRRALVDGEYARVAVEPLALVLHDEARAAVNLYGVVGVLVGVLGVHALGNGREGVGQAGVFLLLLALLGRQLALAGNVVEGLVYVNVACCLVQYRASGVELCLHARQHVVDCGEVNDGCVELAALLCVCQPFVVGSLRHTHRLRGDAQARAVHERHDVLYEAHAGASAQFGLGVLVGQLARGRPVDAQLVLNVAHVYAALPLVIDEHGQAAAVARTLFRACQHEVYVGVAVGYEPLHAVEQPAALLLGVCGLEHHALQVASGVGFCEVHRHGLAGTDARDVFHPLLLAAEFVQSLYAVLQAPYVLEARVGRCHHLRCHGIGRHGQVEAAVSARHAYAP